jgi:hypothetical protein
MEASLPRVLWPIENLATVCGGQSIDQHFENSIGPPESDFVRTVAIPDLAPDVCGAALRVVFLENRTRLPKFLMDHAQKVF